MDYALYQYINRDGVVSHALVNTKTRAVMLADLMSGASIYETSWCGRMPHILNMFGKQSRMTNITKLWQLPHIQIS